MTTTGVNINLVSSQMLERMPTSEKIRFILDEVEQGKVLVLERGLTATEQAQLIEATMAEINQDEFIGIEMQSYAADKESPLAKFIPALRARPRMAVIGPASRLKTIHKDNQQIQTQILSPEGLVAPGA